MIIRLLNPGEGALAVRLAGLAPGAADWPASEYERIAMDRSGTAFCLVAEEPAGEMAGLVAATLAAGEAEVQNLAVAPEKRRRGVASTLLVAALERVVAAGAKSVWLEVRESNREAIAFYERHGFRRAGRRPGYYSNPPDAALILALPKP